MPHGWKLRLVDIDQTLYFIKFKKLYSSKNTSKKWKNKPHLRKANLKSYILIKVSNLENSNSSYKSITKRQPDLNNNNNNKWLRGITRKDIQLVIRHKKRCSPPLDIREMQIKITMNYHFISTRIVKITKTDNTDCYRANRILTYCWRKCKIYNHFVQLSGSFIKRHASTL